MSPLGGIWQKREYFKEPILGQQKSVKGKHIIWEIFYTVFMNTKEFNDVVNGANPAKYMYIVHCTMYIYFIQISIFKR